MGSTKNYLPSGGFSRKEYKADGTTANGIKILGRRDGRHAKTPTFSNTGESYAVKSFRTDLVKQVTVYGAGQDGRGKLKDIDIEHKHRNKQDGRVFRADEIHVHEYIDGKRSGEARKPSKKERRLLTVARYGGVKSR